MVGPQRKGWLDVPGVVRWSMGNIVYFSQCSLDGYIADASGDFSWAEPADDAHRYANEMARSNGTYLLGRRTYDVMRYWDDAREGVPEVEAEFQRAWAAAEKVVYSRSIDDVGQRARIEREFDPAAARALAEASSGDVSIGGSELGGQALAAGIVDVVTLLLYPVLVGGGLQVFPDGVRLDLELIDERRLDRGVVLVSYRVRAQG